MKRRMRRILHVHTLYYILLCVQVYWDWSQDMRPQVKELQERTDLALPNDTPQELFEIAQVCNTSVFC